MENDHEEEKGLTKPEETAGEGGNGRKTMESVAETQELKEGHESIFLEDRQTESKKLFPVVGIGASAGGLEALQEFFSRVREDIGMAFIVISHTDPSRASMLPDILRKHTVLKVVDITHGMAVRANTVYLPPSNMNLVTSDCTFHLKPLDKTPSLRHPIDSFFRSLAESHEEQAGCVILSGTGTDGTLGLKSIKEKNGLAVAQTEESARYSGMPQSAVATGQVDFVLRPSEMPERIAQYFGSEIPIKLKPPQDLEGPSDVNLERIIDAIRNFNGHDFADYKKSTLIRRIQRRMKITQAPDPAGYLKYLMRHPDECQSLFQDLLIGVTSFFRDPQAFEFLGKHVLPELLQRTAKGGPLRIWTTGCSTGEEAYSLAMLVHEAAEELKMKADFQIFATDIDNLAIEKAREGAYLHNIEVDVAPDRLRRFFNREDGGYKVRKLVREPIVFAVQNVLKDPPYSKLDLIVCRNLLIYLEPKAQKKVLPLFHYVLNRGGVLFLGTSETIGTFTELFSFVNKKWNVFQKIGTESAFRPMIDFPSREKRLQGECRAMAGDAQPTVAQAIQKILLEEHTPLCVVVNRKGEIVHIHGRSGKYLEPAPGSPSLNIIDMAREGLRFELAAAIRKVTSGNEEVTRKALRVKTNGDYHYFDLRVKQMGEREPLRELFMIIFEEMAAPPECPLHEEHGDQGDSDQRIAELEGELEKLQQDHRSAQEELETSNEELKSLNEELQSSNEELQSTNEELESSREELQSLNEELTTVNNELHEKVDQVSQSYEGMNDVLNGTRIAFVFLDEHLMIRRFTDEASRLINLIETDIGRPLSHVSTNLLYSGLYEDLRKVLRTLDSLEREVQTNDGHWYLMRIMPFRTQIRIEGLVLTFVNIDELKKTQCESEKLAGAAVESAKTFSDSIINTIRESLLVLSLDFKVLSANRAFYRTFRAKSEDTEGKYVHELGNRQWDIPKLHELLGRIRDTDEPFEDFVVEHEFEGIGRKRMVLNARRLLEKDGAEANILLAIEDATGK
ncbi:MAG: CheR family methyltransferase [Syntrophobacteraceae bacterium]